MPKRTSLATALQDAAAAQPAAPESAAAPAPPKAPRSGTRVISGHFSAEAYRQLRVVAAQEDRTMHDMLKEGLNAVFTARSLPPIA